MPNNDLISRKEAIETFSLVLKGCNPELDPIHIRVLSSAIRLLEDEPAVDAIPVEWLKEQIRLYKGDANDIERAVNNGAIKGIIAKWQKEQEA